jgi:hypothetical protein
MVLDELTSYVNNARWEQVPSLEGRGPGDHIFVVETDDEGQTSICFGDGKTGSPLPEGNLEIRAKYRLTGNPEGELELYAKVKIAGHYSGVRMQQGRVQLDTDMNEGPTFETYRDYFGVYRGFVVANIDPMQKRRLLVQIPDIRDLSIWASACVPHGSTAIPNIGDGVWVIFEKGRIDYPVWIGVIL